MAEKSPPDVETSLLAHLNSGGEVPDSRSYASSVSVTHDELVAVIKSLSAFRIVETTDITKETWVLTDEAKGYVAGGSPEAQLVAAIPPEGASKDVLREKLGSVFDIGMKTAAKNKWIGFEKGNKDLVLTKVDTIKDDLQEQLKRLESGEVLSDKVIDDLKRRKLITKEKSIWYALKKGPQFVAKRKKLATDVTQEHLRSGDWKDLEFKDYNFGAQGQPVAIGYVQPLLEVVREEIQNIFLQMGFTEMPTNNYVESSFWNFDALFQPQQHPARDSHDTFFLEAPAATKQLPEDYLEKVKEVHQRGGYGSKGYGYDWKRDEAEKNLLRTHTTAVSTRMLYKLAQEKPFAPKRYYSIDRVFRNEAVDRTHLAEFHQIEGLICDYGLTLGDLIGVLEDFFSSLGMSKLRFKPAYNPYTEPSMEIFSYHEGLKKWVEVGNSGMFRPEMLLPMGLPEGVNVIAWGLSLERPTMILYGIDNIRDLFGPKVDFNLIKSNPLCRLGLQ
uniref:phenylalanine--tRNA ligase n=1 Tax=Oryza punctata TaxID=4537 RepID=A0A0E0M7G1_ORYPU